MASLHAYSLSELLSLLTGQPVDANDFYLNRFVDQGRLIPHPYRVQCYAIGVPMSGWLEGNLDLNPFRVEPGQILIIAPGQIHRMVGFSTEFAMRTLFFTETFLANVMRLSSSDLVLSFFQPSDSVVMTLSDKEWNRINALVNVIEHHYWFIGQSIHPPVAHLLSAILADLQQIYEASSIIRTDRFSKNRPIELVSQFRQLVAHQYLTRRTVAAYADQLAVSSKHLSETLTALTGKPARHWIDQMLLQEAQVLLRQTNYSVSQITDYLNFSTQAAFGKFFHNKTGVSPSQFRKSDRL